MICKTLNKYEFVQEFDEMNRSENFTVAAREALFDYYADMSDATGEPFELDVIAVCCDWTECTEEELVEEFPGSSIEDVLEDQMPDVFVLFVDHGHGKPDTYLIQS